MLSEHVQVRVEVSEIVVRLASDFQIEGVVSFLTLLGLTRCRFGNRHDVGVPLALEAGNDKAVHNRAGVVGVSVILAAFGWFEGIAAVKELRDVFTDVVVNQELSTRVSICELSDIEDEVVKDDQLSLVFLDLHLEFFLADGVQRLLEFDWILSEVDLVPRLKDGEEDDKERNGNVV